MLSFPHLCTEFVKKMGNYSRGRGIIQGNTVIRIFDRTLLSVRVKLRVGKTLEIYEAQDSEGKLTQPLFILGIGEHYLRNESRKSGTYY